MSDQANCACPDDDIPWHNNPDCPVNQSSLAHAPGSTPAAYWCAFCGVWGDHQSGWCPEIKRRIECQSSKKPNQTMKEYTIKVHEIATDGLPDMDNLTGRVAFIFDGCIISGWPLDDVGHPGFWEADSDVGRGGNFSGVTHWIEFPKSLKGIELA